MQQTCDHMLISVFIEYIVAYNVDNASVRTPIFAAQSELQIYIEIFQKVILDFSFYFTVGSC